MSNFDAEMLETVRRTPARSVLTGYQVTCIWPSRPFLRIAVLHAGAAWVEQASVVNDVIAVSDQVRWFDHCLTGATGSDLSLAWADWADVVVTEPREELIAECVSHGFVPVVGMPSLRHGSLHYRRTLRVVHPWSSRGLALELDLGKPCRGLLASSAGLKTRQRLLNADPAVQWLGA